MSIWDSFYLSPSGLPGDGWSGTIFGKPPVLQDDFLIPKKSNSFTSPLPQKPPSSTWAKLGESMFPDQMFPGQQNPTIADVSGPVSQGLSSMGAGATSSFQALIDKITWTAKEAVKIALKSPVEDAHMKALGGAVRSGEIKPEDIPAELREKYGTPGQATLQAPGESWEQDLNNDILYPLREKTIRLTQELRREGVQDEFISQILESVGAAAVDIPMYVATGNVFGPLNFAIHGFAEGMESSDNDLLKGGVPGGMRGFLVDKIFKAAHKVLGEQFKPVGKQVKARMGTALGFAGSNALGSVTEGEAPTLKGMGASAITGAILPTFQKKGTPVKEQVLPDNLKVPGQQIEGAVIEPPGKVKERGKFPVIDEPPIVKPVETEIEDFTAEIERMTLGLKDAEGARRIEEKPTGTERPIEPTGKKDKQAAAKVEALEEVVKIPAYREAGWWARLWGSTEGSVEKLGEWLKDVGLSSGLYGNQIVEDPLNPKVMTEVTRGWVGSAKQVLEKGPYSIDKTGNITLTNEGMEPIYRDFVAASGIKPRKAVDLLGRYWDLIRIETDLQQEITVPRYNAKTGEKEMVTRTKASDVDKEWAAKERPEIDALLASNPELKPLLDQALQRKNAFQHAWLDMFVESGMKSREEVERMKAENPNHIPFGRIIAGMDDPGIIDQLTGDVTFKTIFPGNPIKSFKGGEFKRGNSAKVQTQRVFAGERIMLQNRTKQAIAAMSEWLPDIYEKPGKFKVTEVTKQEVARGVKAAGEEIGPEELESIAVFRPKDIQHLETDLRGRPQEMLVYVDGKPKLYHVPTTIAEAFSHLPPGTGLANFLPNLLKLAFGAPKRFFQRTVTSWNPAFALFKNPIRDNMAAFMQTNLGFVPFMDPIKLAFDMANKDYYNTILEHGGSMEGYSLMNRKNILTTARELAGDKPLLRKLNVFRYIEDMGHYMEMLTRKTVVKKAKEAGYSDIGAAAASRGATLDFLRSGYASRQVNAVSDFFNATIQGESMFYRALKEHPVKTAIKGISTITVPTVLFFLLHHADEESAQAYKSKASYEKDFFLSIPDKVPVLGGLSFPLPVIWGQFFGALVARGMQDVVDKDPHAYDGVLSLLLGAASPVGGSGGGFDIEGILPTLLQLVAELYSNKDMFRGEDIYPSWKKDSLLAEDTYGSRTEKIYKQMGELPVKLGADEGIPPELVRHTVRGIAGPVGEAIMTGANALLNPDDKKKPGDPPTEDIPFLKQLTSRSSQSNPVEIHRFYKWFEQLKKAKGSYNKAKKAYDGNRTKENRNKVRSILGRFPILEDTAAGETSSEYKRVLAGAEDLKKLRKRIEEYVQSDLPREEKVREIRALERAMWEKAIALQEYFKF